MKKSAILSIAAIATAIIIISCGGNLEIPVPAHCEDDCNFASDVAWDKEEEFSATSCRWSCSISYEKVESCGCQKNFDDVRTCIKDKVGEDKDVAACWFSSEGYMSNKQEKTCKTKDAEDMNDIITDDCENEIEDQTDCMSDCSS